MSNELILSIDAGTQSIRSALVDLKGNIRCIVKTPIEPYFSEKPGWAEQQPDYYWQKLCETCLAMFSKTTESKENIAGVTISTQRATVVDVDKNGNPLRPAMVWLDSRKADPKGMVPIVVQALSKIINSKLAVEAVRDCEINWIKQNQPEIWEKTYKHLLLSGFFTYKLTGEFIDSCGNIVGYVPFDNKTGKWAA